MRKTEIRKEKGYSGNSNGTQTPRHRNNCASLQLWLCIVIVIVMIVIRSYSYSYCCSYSTHRHQYEINFAIPSGSLCQICSGSQENKNKGNDYVFIRVSGSVEQLLKTPLRPYVSLLLSVHRKKSLRTDKRIFLKFNVEKFG